MTFKFHHLPQHTLGGNKLQAVATVCLIYAAKFLSGGIVVAILGYSLYFPLTCSSQFEPPVAAVVLCLPSCLNFEECSCYVIVNQYAMPFSELNIISYTC